MRIFTFLILLSLGAWTQAQTTVTLTPSKDNTLYQNSQGTISNGAGIHLFSGRTNSGSLRRAVLAFDLLDDIPAGATISEVSLTMNVNKQRNSATASANMLLHRLTADWGQGTSNAGTTQDGSGTAAMTDDATWIHAFFDRITWANAGGDFVADPSATTEVDGLGSVTWTSATLAADVQAWVDDPASNFGWILIGDESTNGSARRFLSAESSNAANQPTLSVTFTTTTSIAADVLADQVKTYPNPVSNQLTVVAEAISGPLTLQVLDLSGRMLQRETITAPATAEFSLETLPAGVYLLRLETEEATAVRKITRQ